MAGRISRSTDTGNPRPEPGDACLTFFHPGIHPGQSGSGLTIRAWHPDAECIELVQESTGKSLGRMNRLANGFFELSFPQRKKVFYYLLNITLKDGTEELRFDPYQFGEYTLCQQDIDPLHLYRHLGALKVEHAITRQRSVSGVLFKVYAPMPVPSA